MTKSPEERTGHLGDSFGVRHQGPDSKLGKAVGKDTKGLVSLALYLVAIPGAFLNGWLALTCYIVVALIWLVPDRRIERHLHPEA